MTDFAGRLRERSLRVTQPRLAVLEAVAEYPHEDTDSIIRRVRLALPAVSHQAVYDSLHILSEVGLLRRVQPAGTVARYEARIGDNHHHFVCRSCGTIVDVDCVVGAAPCLTPSDDHGFVVDQADVTFWGLCPTCAAQSSPDVVQAHVGRDTSV